MKPHYLVATILLTAAYLILELAFNARLLDAVGSGVDTDTLHRMENYGRALSGLAVALFVLQFGFIRRSRGQAPQALRSPSWKVIGFACFASGAITFVALREIVDYVVRMQDAEFRRGAVTLVLLRQSLLTNHAEIAGLPTGERLIGSPEGKAFIALFPFLMGWSPNLSARVDAAKEEMVGRKIRASIPVSRYYEAYREAIEQTHSTWQRYSRWRKIDLDSEVASRHESAWAEYLESLGRKGWTPSTIPPTARRQVVRQLSKEGLALPSGWHPADEFEFRKAVQKKVQAEIARLGDGSVSVGGARVPPGLGWSAFLAHHGLQSELRKKLRLSPNVIILPRYKAADFERGPYAQMIRQAARSELETLDSPATEFVDGASLHKQGLAASQAVIAPALALGFSLLGAITHAGKLLYLCLLGGIQVFAALRKREASHRAEMQCKGIVAALFVSTIVALSQIDNAITASPVYRFVEEATLGGPEADTTGTVVGRARATALRVVAVGQSYSYPINEAIRNKVLHDFEFGFRKES